MRTPLVIFLLALCCAAFAPGLRGPFLLDDFTSVVPAKIEAASLEAVVDVATRDRAGELRRPISALSFAANHATTGSDAFGFKATNLVLHGIVAMLCFFFLRHLFALLCPWPAERISAAAGWSAAVWAVHPLQVSTVLYVVQRMAEFSTLFTLAALLVVVRWLREQPRPAIAPALSAYAAWAVVAIACKENGALIPVFAALLFWLASRSAEPSDRKFAAWAVALPMVAGAVVLVALFPKLIDAYALRDFTIGERLLAQGRALWFYLSMFAWPDPANMGLYHDDFRVSPTADWREYLPSIAWAAVVAVAIAVRRRAPLVTFAAGWFLAAHLLESTIVSLELVFEHRNYLALLGPAALVGAALSTVARASSPIVRATPLALILLLAGLTLGRAHDWSSVDRFYLAEYRHHPDSPRAMNAMAALAVQSTRYDDAGILIDRLKARLPRRAWPLLLDAHLRCATPERPVDWAELERRFETGPLTRSEYDMLTMLAERRGGEPPCTYVEMAPLRALVAAAIARYERDGDAELVEGMLVAEALAIGPDAPIDERMGLLGRAAQANPQGTKALMARASLEHALGRFADVEETLAELRARDAEHGLTIGYRIDQLQASLAPP